MSETPLGADPVLWSESLCTAPPPHTQDLAAARLPTVPWTPEPRRHSRAARPWQGWDTRAPWTAPMGGGARTETGAAQSAGSPSSPGLGFLLYKVRINAVKRLHQLELDAGRCGGKSCLPHLWLWASVSLCPHL